MLKVEKLPIDIFTCIIKYTPLVSIDLVVENQNGQFLFGKRKNEPAKNFYFVPGGRIFKNETLKEAFQRIMYEELGKSFDIKEAELFGIYEHFYKNSFVSNKISTHYIVLAYKIKLKEDLKLPKLQHSEYVWFSEKEILENSNIHSYSKAYFGG